MVGKLISQWASYGGQLSVLDHDSTSLGCPMRFAVFEPPRISKEPSPVLWFLSGLTCTWANVMEKSGIMAHAARHGLVVVAPDTSPRGEAVPDDSDYDLGQGAGFYLSATEPPYDKNFKMDAYLLNDLSHYIESEFNVDMGRQAIMGHSMGGHGALTLHLKNQERYRSCSALAPIVSPSSVPWGRKAFSAYLGKPSPAWNAYDATELVKVMPSKRLLLIDQGQVDPFLREQLDPTQFLEACAGSGQNVLHSLHEGYDHSYYFVASMMEKHVAHHAENLK